MATKCSYCFDKIKETEEAFTCPNCKRVYHKRCFDRIAKCGGCGYDKKELQKEIEEKNQKRIEHLKSIGKKGYYEYKVISIVDKKGAVDIERLMSELNDLGLDGWRLQCAYSNEMGKDALSVAGFGINATADQNILILERFVSIG